MAQAVTRSSAPAPNGTATTGHLGQLDGLRAVAIGAVIVYHLGYLPGGWLGVDVFFVLSGYLITWILLSRGGPDGRLGWFWGRRARRLLPAVLLLLVALAVYAWVGGPGVAPAQMRNPSLATLFYTANWQEMVGGHSYFAQYLQPNPFQHTWSLAIEEQYYLLWPLLLWVLLGASRRVGSDRPRPPVIVTTVVLAAASAAWMGVAEHLFGPNRAYLGTDTRAWELLLGGVVAMLWSPTARKAGGRAAGAAITVGVLGLAAGIATAGGPPTWIWDGGLVAVALCTAGVIVGSVHAPDHPVARVLALPPVRWVGLISYSLYLWHWPAIVLIAPSTTGLSGAPLLAARVAAMLAAACASYYIVERPLRTLDWAELGRRLRVRQPAFAAVGIIAAAAIIAAGTEGPGRAPSARVSLDSFPGPTAAEMKMHLDVPPASPANPYRVWILGDSVVVDSSLGIQAALEATGAAKVVVNSSFPGWSPRLDKHWPVEAPKTIATYRPQIVLGTWSWDDEAAAADPAAYRIFLENTLRTLLTPGNGVEAVVLFQFPQGGPGASLTASPASDSQWRRHMAMQAVWNQVASEAVTAFPGRAVYLTTDRAFAPGGRYYTWMRTAGGAWVRARKLDNAHMCPFGAALFGAVAEADLAYYLHLPAMRPGWETGAWTADRRYNDPPGACPNDQPPPGYSGVPLPH